MDAAQVLRQARASCMAGPMPGSPLLGKGYCSIAPSEDFRYSFHQFGQLLDFILLQILAEAGMETPPGFHFLPADARHDAHEFDFASGSGPIRSLSLSGGAWDCRPLRGLRGRTPFKNRLDGRNGCAHAQCRGRGELWIARDARQFSNTFSEITEHLVL